MSKYDVVMMGAGHNGQVASCYLVDAGKKTRILKRQAWPGGGLVTCEISVLGLRGKVFGAMPVTARLSPEDARAALRLFDAGTLWFIMTTLFRRSAPATKRERV